MVMLCFVVNVGDFIVKVQEIFGCLVQVISGEEEVCLIYQGVVYIIGGVDQRLVVDIGGVSIELVIGMGV